jgi:imidazolonepropionase-like amidohydrolase
VSSVFVLPEDTTVHATWFMDGMATPVQKNITLHIQKGMIGKIDTDLSRAPVGPERVDFTGCTILPGLIDSHVHVFMSGTRDKKIREHQLHAEYADMRTVIARHLDQHLACGIFAVRDGGDYNALAWQYKMAAEASRIDGVHLSVAGRGWRNNGRYGKLVGRPPAGGQTLAEAILADSNHIDHVKIINSGLNSLKQYGKETAHQFDLPTMRAAVTAAGQLGLKTMVHANGRLPVKIAIEAGCSSIEHGFFMGDENLKKMADHQVAWVPTAITMLAYSEKLDPHSIEAGIARRNFEHQLEQMALARKYGVPVVLGTDAGSLGVHHGASVRRELALLIQAGFPIPEAVRCGTHNGAKLLGLTHAGGLRPGKDATFIAVDGPPSGIVDGLGQIRAFYIKGRRVF